MTKQDEDDRQSKMKCLDDWIERIKKLDEDA